MRNFFYFLGILVVVGAVLMIYRFWTMVSSNPGQVYCAQDVQLCLNGTYVGRTGPKCEFSACPNYISETTEDASRGISYNYPKLETKYISPVKWPPGVLMETSTFVCTPGGSEIALQGATEKKVVNGRTYCIKRESDGAAGSIYTTFTYTTPTETDRILVGSTTLRFIQCGNYDDPNKTACEKERNAFSLDQIMDMVLGSVRSYTSTTPQRPSP